MKCNMQLDSQFTQMSEPNPVHAHDTWPQHPSSTRQGIIIRLLSEMTGNELNVGAKPKEKDT